MGPRARGSSRKRGRGTAVVPAGGEGGPLTLSRVCVKCHALKVKCSGTCDAMYLYIYDAMLRMHGR